MSREEFLREVQTLSKCSSDYVVQYFDSWIENNSCLYIQMELCSDNLKNIIQQKTEFFDRRKSETMNSIEYFISCQLFKELLECVQYLHESKPPIIHRDLKTENILIDKSSKNGRFLKLCDFGLAKFDAMTTVTHSQGQGTSPYMAPEVKNGTKYNTKADVYSIGILSRELFNLSSNT